MELREYSKVRVRRLLRPLAEYDGWRVNLRPPQVGEAGIIVDVQRLPSEPDRLNYVVESLSSRPDGGPVWLSDFTAEELEGLPGKSASPEP
jgi:hypothetical protein